MSSETRLVRPYGASEQLRDSLDGVHVRCADRVVAGDETIVVELDEYLNHPVELILDVDWETVRGRCEDLEIPLDAVELVVLVSSVRLRSVETILRQSLLAVEQLGGRLSLGGDERPRALQAPHGGADVQVYLCLGRNLAARPLRPWRRGTWLAHQQFRIRSELSGSGFVPIRMTDEDRAHLGLPTETTRFVATDDVDPFDSEVAPDAVKLYVDGDLLDRLATATNSSVAKHVQRQLFLDAVTATVFAAHRALIEQPDLAEQSVDDFEGSLVHRLTGIVAGQGTDARGREGRQVAFRRLKDSPTVLVAQIEAAIGLKKDMLDSFGGVR